MLASLAANCIRHRLAPASADAQRPCACSPRDKAFCLTTHLLAMLTRAALLTCPGRANHLPLAQIAVNPHCKKYFAFPETQITCIADLVPRLSGGRIAIVTRRGAGCDGRFGLRWTSADRSGRRSRVVVVPRRWDQVFAGEAREATEAIKPGTPARARSKP